MYLTLNKLSVRYIVTVLPEMASFIVGTHNHLTTNSLNNSLVRVTNEIDAKRLVFLRHNTVFSSRSFTDYTEASFSQEKVVLSLY